MNFNQNIVCKCNASLGEFCKGLELGTNGWGCHIKLVLLLIKSKAITRAHHFGARESFTALTLECTVKCSRNQHFLNTTTPSVHCTALYCTTPHCTAVHCTVLHCTALHCTAPDLPPVHLSAVSLGHNLPSSGD